MATGNSKRNYSDIVVDGFDVNESVELTEEKLAEKGVTIMGYGLQPNQAVYIPTVEEGRKTKLVAIRKGGEKNVPVVVAVKAEKLSDGKYKVGTEGVLVGISSLFQLDAFNKPHEQDETSKKCAHLSNHKERLDAIAGNVILAGAEEVVLKVQRTENGVKADGSRSVTRLYNTDGSPVIRDKRIVPSSILDQSQWTA